MPRAAGPDSAHIVQATHATLAGLDADVWFEYVRTDANVADAPSREDLSTERYELGAKPAQRLAAMASSSPVELVLPTPSEWDADAAIWEAAARRWSRESPAP